MRYSIGKDLKKGIIFITVKITSVITIMELNKTHYDIIIPNQKCKKIAK